MKNTIVSIRHTISIIVLLLAIWLLNSGHYSLLMLAFGVVSIALVTFIAHKMDVVDEESQPIHLTLRIFPYYLWLFKQIVLANLELIKRIWRGPSSISPRMAIITASQQTDMGKVIYANSITLTPGTVTMDVHGDQFLVHALTSEGMDELISGEMDRRATEIE